VIATRGLIPPREGRVDASEASGRVGEMVC
jgi:hypothetical protein